MSGLCLNQGTYFLFVNKFIYFIYLFFGCFGSSLLHAGFLQLRRAGATLRCGAGASHCGGFSCCGAWALGTRASVVVAHGLSSCGSRALEHRLSSCGAWAQLLRGMWDPPGPGLKPVSPALAGGFLTTAPPGKPKELISYGENQAQTEQQLANTIKEYLICWGGNNKYPRALYASLSSSMYVGLFDPPHTSTVFTCSKAETLHITVESRDSE